MPRRPRWAATPAQIKQAESLTGYGFSLEKIATLFGVSKVTFERAAKKNNALREALLNGRVKADATVVDSLFNMAKSGKCPAATIFWTKVRCRWREPPQEVQFPDEEGNPQAINAPTSTVIVLPAKDTQ